MRIHPVWSESSLYVQLVAKHPTFLYADSEDSDQTGRMPRLIWVFAGRITTLLILSWGGSFAKVIISVSTWSNNNIENLLHHQYMDPSIPESWTSQFFVHMVRDLVY